jgi:hypothetical protein
MTAGKGDFHSERGRAVWDHLVLSHAVNIARGAGIAPAGSPLPKSRSGSAAWVELLVPKKKRAQSWARLEVNRENAGLAAPILADSQIIFRFRHEVQSPRQL